MKVQVLMATMHRNPQQVKKIIEDSGLFVNTLVINQCGKNGKTEWEQNNKHVTVVDSETIGLSKSRNLALKYANADIVLLADDDILYESNLEQILQEEFEKHPEYDMIAFYVERSSNFCQKDLGKEKKITKLSSLGLMSVQIAFRLSVIREKGICFDESFGAGSGKYICGEENIFLFDCLNEGLRIGYIPRKIATTQDNESSWFHGHNEIYFKSKGAVFQRLFPKTARVWILAFGLLKYHEYKSDMSINRAMRYMLEGQETCKNRIKV